MRIRLPLNRLLSNTYCHPDRGFFTVKRIRRTLGILMFIHVPRRVVAGYLDEVSERAGVLQVGILGVQYVVCSALECCKSATFTPTTFCYVFI